MFKFAVRLNLITSLTEEVSSFKNVLEVYLIAGKDGERKYP